MAQFEKNSFKFYMIFVAFEANSSAQNFQSENLPAPKILLLEGMVHCKTVLYTK